MTFVSEFSVSRMTAAMRRLLAIFALALFAFAAAPSAEAQSALEVAKYAGQVGERIDGYVGLVQSGAPSDVRALVERINQERRAEYERIARERGVEVAVVAQVVGERQIDRAPAGTYIMGADGAWRQK